MAAPKKPACRHARARMVAHLACADDDTIIGDRALLWCPRCGALGRVVYGDGEQVTWIRPRC
jgi:hypothetical protein